MKNTILSLEQQAMERWRNGDPHGFVELSADDITYIDPGLTQPIRGRQEYASYMQKIEGQVHYQGSEFIDPCVHLCGDAALLTFNYRSTVLTPQGTVLKQTPWNATEVYFRRAGQWQIVHSHWSYIHHRLPASLQIPLPVQMTPLDYKGVFGKILALEFAAMERWRKGDPGGFLEIMAPQITYFDTGTPQRVNGLQAMQAEYASRAGKIFYDVMDFIDPHLQLMGDMAVLSYRFFSTRLHPDGSILSRIPWNCSAVYMRQNRKWRMIHNHWSFINGERDD